METYGIIVSNTLLSKLKTLLNNSGFKFKTNSVGNNETRVCVTSDNLKLLDEVRNNFKKEVMPLSSLSEEELSN